MKMTFNDFTMSGLTPYTGEFVGYELNKGKLLLDVDLLFISNRRYSHDAA